MKAFDFISICDCIKPKLSNRNKHDLHKQIEVCIKDLQSIVGEKDAVVSIRRIRTTLIYLSILDDNKDYSQYYDILDVIMEKTGWQCQLLDRLDCEEWSKLIYIVKQTLHKYPKTDGFMKEDMYHHELERARAAKRLRKYGVTVNVIDNDIVFCDIEKAFNRVDVLVSSLGGISIISSLIRNLPIHRLSGRIMIPYQGNQPMPSMVDPELPWGYLYNVCQKHLLRDDSVQGGQEEYSELIQLVTDVALAFYDVQKFDFYEDLFHREKNLIQQVRTLITRHVLYTFPQCHPLFVHLWCKKVIEDAKIHKECNDELRSLLDEFWRVKEYIARLSKEKEFVLITTTTIDNALGFSLDKVIKKYIIASASNLNKNYMMPDNYMDVNSWKYPLVQVSDDKLLLYPASIGAWNWYEALLLLIKKYSEVIVGDIGYSIEGFISESMNKHNITMQTGKYKIGSEEGECDILVEAKIGDMLFECKKKPLTAKAKRGSDIKAWEDLSASLIESQYQCSRTERGVKTCGVLKLHNEKNKSDYDYRWVPQYISSEDGTKKSRYIEKITLTLNPFGFMQDGVVVSRMLEEMMNKTFYVDFKGFEDQYSTEEQDTINEQFRELNHKLSDIASNHKIIGEDNPFFHSRFLDLEKLYFLVTLSNGNNDFFAKASKKYCTAGTQDFWREMYLLKPLEDAQ